LEENTKSFKKLASKEVLPTNVTLVNRRKRERRCRKGEEKESRTKEGGKGRASPKRPCNRIGWALPFQGLLFLGPDVGIAYEAAPKRRARLS
jgi:hypothetical protein